MNKELRFNEENLKSTDRNVEGYAIVFNSDSNVLYDSKRNVRFIERIVPEAIQGVIERSDIIAVLNHNKDRGVLARSKKGTGSLSIEVDERGVKYRFDAPHTALGDEVLEGINRGDITSNSFRFTIAENGEKWDRVNNMLYRTITKIGAIYDFSLVYSPAYEDALIIDSRSLDDFLENEQRDSDSIINEEDNINNKETEESEDLPIENESEEVVDNEVKEEERSENQISASEIDEYINKMNNEVNEIRKRIYKNK